jgi:hypothetical protein
MRMLSSRLIEDIQAFEKSLRAAPTLKAEAAMACGKALFDKYAAASTSAIVRANAAAHTVASVTAHVARQLESMLDPERQFFDEDARECALLTLISRWDEERAHSPFYIVSYEALLWPQRVRELDTGLLTKQTHEWIVETAKNYLKTATLPASDSEAQEQLRAHWSLLATGALPNGFRGYAERFVPQHESFSLRALLDLDASKEALSISAYARDWLVREARALLTRDKDANSIETSKRQHQHLEAIARGELPYGFHCAD